MYFILRNGPGVGAGVGAGVRVDQEPGVVVGVGVGTAPPRLRTHGLPLYPRAVSIPNPQRPRHSRPGVGRHPPGIWGLVVPVPEISVQCPSNVQEIWQLPVQSCPKRGFVENLSQDVEFHLIQV